MQSQVRKPDRCLQPSPYFQSSQFPQSDTLATESSCDVCVIGAGVSGLSVGYELASRGHRVIVIDGDELGRGETARSTAHLVTALDERYFVLEEQFGPTVTRAAAAAHACGIDWIEQTVARHGIACGFRRVPGMLVVPRDRGSEAESLLAREMAAAKRAGVESECINACHALVTCQSSALQFPGQAQLQPVAFLAGLAKAIQHAGGLIVTNHLVTDILTDLSPMQCLAGGKRVQARHVVIATHSIPTALRPQLRKIRQFVSHVVTYALDPRAQRLEPSLLWDGYWDTDTPYHYVRIDDVDTGDANLQRIVVGGEDCEVECPRDEVGAYARLDRWTHEHFPFVGEPLHRWWGRIDEPDGEFALIGGVPNSPGLYIVAGDSGNGMTYGAIAARRIATMIEGLPTIETEDVIFDPATVAGAAR